MLWKHNFFMDEMGINVHIALEAGLGTLRQRLSKTAGRDVSYTDTLKFVGQTFTHGAALAEFWEERRDERNMLIHPDATAGAYVMHPMLADDIDELLDPMLTLYRYLLLGLDRPKLV